jgi:hypothetical protein
MPVSVPRYAVGDRIAYWKVIHRRSVPRGSGLATYFCRCVCGRARWLFVSNLNSGNTRSCGCRKAGVRSRASKKHGFSRTPSGRPNPLYCLYRMMIYRCENPKSKSYKNYGGRGIRVCVRWKRSFPAFMRNVGKRPSRRHTLERRNNDGHYSPGNVYWLLKSKQGHNTRQSVVIEYRGVRRTMKQWSKRLGIHYDAIRNRRDRGVSIKFLFSRKRLRRGTR